MYFEVKNELWIVKMYCELWKWIVNCEKEFMNFENVLWIVKMNCELWNELWIVNVNVLWIVKMNCELWKCIVNCEIVLLI